MRFSKYLILFFCLGQCLFSNHKLKAQNEERIVVVPFDRLSFLSGFDLKKIADVNGMPNTEEVYDNFKNKFVEEVSGTALGVSFFELTENERKELLRRVPFIFKKEPISHFGFDLSNVIDNGVLASLLKNLDADYILFMGHFEIKKKKLVSNQNFEGSKFTNWSTYSINYEVYDSNGNLIALDDKFEVRPSPPNKETYITYGLLLASLENRFGNFQEEIISKIKRYKGKPIYK